MLRGRTRNTSLTAKLEAAQANSDALSGIEGDPRLSNLSRQQQREPEDSTPITHKSTIPHDPKLLILKPICFWSILPKRFPQQNCVFIFVYPVELHVQSLLTSYISLS
jgi:hypothetical protein